MFGDRPPVGRALGACALGVLLVLVAGAGARANPVSANWTWTDRSAPVAPPAAAGTLVAYDPTADRLLFFGGWNGTTLNETWEYDPTDAVWTELRPTASPESRADAALVFDIAANEFVLFGGWTQFSNGTIERLDDTWTFSLLTDQWVLLDPPISPSPRSDSAVAYDAAAAVILLYGGFSGTAYLGDSWSFNLATDLWSPVAEVGPTPGVRSDGRMVYDPAADEFVLFGGNDYNGPNLTFHHLNDTWLYRLGSGQWTLVVPSTVPDARDYAVEGFDPASGSVLLFSGYGNRSILDDTWAFSTSTDSWEPLTTSGPPPGRYAGGGAFDTDDGSFLIVGGLGSSGLLNDTWSLEETSVPSSGTGSGISVVEVGAFALVGLLFVAIAARVAISRRTKRTPKPAPPPRERDAV